MKIQFLYFDGCPSHETALDRLKKAMQLEKINAPIEIKEISTQKEAENFSFLGSPTILINDEDIDLFPQNPHFALTCSAYTLPNGKISPLPPLELIQHALRK